MPIASLVQLWTTCGRPRGDSGRKSMLISFLRIFHRKNAMDNQPLSCPCLSPPREAPLYTDREQVLLVHWPIKSLLPPQRSNGPSPVRICDTPMCPSRYTAREQVVRPHWLPVLNGVRSARHASGRSARHRTPSASGACRPHAWRAAALRPSSCEQRRTRE
jgi:hypothetical protein